MDKTYYPANVIDVMMTFVMTMIRTLLRHVDATVSVPATFAVPRSRP
jgi:hypothetical protein